MTMGNWAFQPTNVTSSSFSGYIVCHVHVAMALQDDHRPASVAALARKYEADPRKAAALSRARQKLANRVASESGSSLAHLRLKAGLSQSKLAEKMGVQQPYIARIERGDDDLKISTIENLARALNMATADVFIAVESARLSRGAKNV